jgi:hypothetical protein
MRVVLQKLLPLALARSKITQIRWLIFMECVSVALTRFRGADLPRRAKFSGFLPAFDVYPGFTDAPKNTPAHPNRPPSETSITVAEVY